MFNGRGGRTRTDDLGVPNAARYQLRHTPLYSYKRYLKSAFYTSVVGWRFLLSDDPEGMRYFR